MSTTPEQPKQPEQSTSRHYWSRRLGNGGGWATGPPPGQDLSAMRRGFGVPAGAVPRMWPFYTTLDAGGRLTGPLRAEHVALSLYGLHQQSQGAPMHRVGVGLGWAMGNLRASGRYSEAAVDSRFMQAATASDIDELGFHLRGLISQLKTLQPPQPLDYTRLYGDLRSWQQPAQIGRIRRRWASDYFRSRAAGPDPKQSHRKALA